MEIRLLGQVEVRVGDRLIPIGPRKQRLILAVLALEPRRQISVDRLIELLWPEEPPPSAFRSVQVSVSRLRSAIAAGGGDPTVLRTAGTGYVLDAEPAAIDAHRFTELLQRAEAAADAEDQLALLDQALALWRGSALGGDAPPETRERLCLQLDDARVAAMEERFDARLRLGQHDGVIGELTQWLVEHPLRERPRSQLMLALYRAGRRAEALAAYREARELLVRELGLEPAPELAALERAILVDDPALLPPPQPTAVPELVPAQLPGALVTLTGRDAELRRLDALLPHQPAGRPTAAALAVVSGTGGVGKTTLAVHWAHRVAPHFPHGQLHADLRGFDPGGGLSAEEVLPAFLQALGVPPDGVPSSPLAQGALFRSMLAGRQVLIVLDNARSADQVRPLLPGAPGCMTIVTSRSLLTGLVATEGALSVVLNVLDEDDARELIARRAGLERVTAEPRAAEELVARCAGLPLALAVVAARAATRPRSSLASLAAELGDAREGLDAFSDPDLAIDLRMVFSCSYRALSTPAARLFRLLGLCTGADIDLTAAAALAGAPVGAARRLLTELLNASLLIERVPGRYGCHDLLRAYAAELVHAEDDDDARRAAMTRILRHFTRTALAAARVIEPHREFPTAGPCPEGVAERTFTTADEALRWLDAQRPQLVASVGQAAGAGFEAEAWQLAWALVTYGQRRGYWHELDATLGIALEAARRVGDVAGQVHAHRGLARALIRLGDIENAHAHLAAAEPLCESLGDLTSLGRVHTGLAFVQEKHGDLRAALRHAQTSLELFRRAGPPNAEGEALNAVGWTFLLLGDPKRALEYCRSSIALHERIGDTASLPVAWDSLGYAYHRLGRYSEAVHCLHTAVGMFEHIGERYLLADTLQHLGEIHAAGGDPGSARAVLLRALAILEELGHGDTVTVRLRLRDLPGPTVISA